MARPNGPDLAGLLADVEALKAAIRLALPILDDDLESFRGDTPPRTYDARGFICLDDLSCCDHSRWKDCEATLTAMAAIRDVLPEDEWIDGTYAESQLAVDHFRPRALLSVPVREGEGDISSVAESTSALHGAPSGSAEVGRGHA